MNKLLRQTNLFVKRHGSTILTCVGSVGVVATAVMTSKATPKAARLLEDTKKKKGEKLTKLEKVKVTAHVYIPTILVGASTIACIFGANVLNKRQQAGLMSAYALIDNSFKEYKSKVKELYGEEGFKNIQNELAKDKYEDDTKIDDGKQLFYDEFSGRYFESTMEQVLTAEYELNRMLSIDSGLYLNEFYDLLDIPTIECGNQLGWSGSELVESYWYCWIEFTHKKVIMEDGLVMSNHLLS